MDEMKVIPITKEFDREKLANAVIAYMTPNSENERIEHKCVGDTYNICVYYKPNKKKDKWIEARYVQLLFGEDTCSVGIYYQTGRKENRTDVNIFAGTAAVACVAAPLALPALIAGVGAAAGANMVHARKFKNDILKIVISYIGDEKAEKMFIEKMVEDNEADSASEQTDKPVETNTWICSCGYQLNGDMKFCPECGKTRDNGMRTCRCGKQIEREMKFCPYCGEKIE